MSFAFGEPPDSGVAQSADAIGATSSSRTVAAANARRSARRRCKARGIITVAGSWKAAASLVAKGAFSGTSLPSEPRLPLLHERAHALDEVVRSRQPVLQVCLEVELLVHVRVEHVVERLLRAGVGAGWAGGHLLGERVRLVHQAVVGVEEVHEAPVERLLRRHALA